MNNNHQNDNIEFLDVDNNENVATTSEGDKTVNTTVNPNAYHPSLNNNQTQVQNNSQTTTQSTVNPNPSPVYRLNDNEEHEEVKENKFMYVILSTAYAILSVGLYGLIGGILIICAIGLIFRGPAEAISTLEECFLEVWWIILILFMPLVLIRHEMNKYNIDVREALRNSIIVSLIFDALHIIFSRRR